MKLNKGALSIWHSYQTRKKFQKKTLIALQENWFDAYNLPLMKKIFSTGLISINEQEVCGCTAFMKATSRNHLNMIKWFMQKGVNIQDKSLDNGTAFHIAARVGSIDILELLYSTGQINIDEQDFQGRTALMEAVFSLPSLSIDDVTQQTVAKLLAWGANPCVQDKKGLTALDYVDSELLSVQDVDHQIILLNIKKLLQ